MKTESKIGWGWGSPWIPAKHSFVAVPVEPTQIGWGWGSPWIPAKHYLS